MNRLEEIRKEIQELKDLMVLKEATWDFTKPFDEYQKLLQPELDKADKLDNEYRLIQPYTLRPLSIYGTVMSLENFVEYCVDHFFINYDGFGRYVKENQESDITIYPSDVTNGNIRSDFDTIIWFNR